MIYGDGPPTAVRSLSSAKPEKTLLLSKRESSPVVWDALKQRGKSRPRDKFVEPTTGEISSLNDGVHLNECPAHIPGVASCMITANCLRPLGSFACLLYCGLVSGKMVGLCSSIYETTQISDLSVNIGKSPCPCDGKHITPAISLLVDFLSR